MTASQLLAFAILAGMMVLFLWGRIRYDLVAVLALLAGVFGGIIPADAAFTGFSDDIVIIVGSALIVSAAVGRSGIIETAIDRVGGRITRPAGQLLLLTGSVTLLSSLVKNVGALAMLIPAATHLGKKSGTSPSMFLMPMAFGSLLGGLITLVGTSPNIIVSRVREDLTGTPFSMFDYAPTGLGLSAVGLVFLFFAHRLLPHRKPLSTMEEALDVPDYMTEAAIPEGSTAEGITIGEFRQRAGPGIIITRLLRGQSRTIVPLPDAHLTAGDILLLQGDPQALERAIAATNLRLAGQHRDTSENGGEVGVIEAVVGRDSSLVGQAAGRIALHYTYGVNLLAVSRRGQRLTERLRDISLCPGDVIVLQGSIELLPERLRELGCLPLAERPMRLGSVRKGLVPLAILAGAMVLAGSGVLSVGIAFFTAAALVLLTGALPLRDAYKHVDWPILIMIGALLPVAEALSSTGGTDLIAGWLSQVAIALPPWAAVGLMMVAAMALTPFLNNAATVLMMAPIAATFANQLGYQPEAFLIAVAIGAGCDFLTPIGHQCNTLVLGPGGYRFGDYARLGAPLSLLVVLTGVPLTLAFWPV
jgi:di/tricarboxylate transporter